MRDCTESSNPLVHINSLVFICVQLFLKTYFIEFYHNLVLCKLTHNVIFKRFYSEL